ncbi:MAG: 2-amino-4-hydroxy-6-hydroxymethyldihydropteridine diphosphokinase [Myxococcota bacterium]
MDAVIALGSSLGDRERNLILAVRALDATKNVTVTAGSHLWWSLPLTPDARGRFLNAAVRIETTLLPQALLRRCKAIERRLGRKPGVRWSDRIVDLDILLYGEAIIEGADLRIPHVEMLNRNFALVPAWEVAPEMVHPDVGLRLSEIPMSPLGLCPAGVVSVGGLRGHAGRSTARR